MIHHIFFFHVLLVWNAYQPSHNGSALCVKNHSFFCWIIHFDNFFEWLAVNLDQFLEHNDISVFRGQISFVLSIGNSIAAKVTPIHLMQFPIRITGTNFRSTVRHINKNIKVTSLMPTLEFSSIIISLRSSCMPIPSTFDCLQSNNSFRHQFWIYRHLNYIFRQSEIFQLIFLILIDFWVIIGLPVKF